MDTGTKDGSNAYKLDASARWVEWAETANLTMSSLTSPEAPRYFLITHRRLVGAGGPGGDGSQETVCAWADHMGYPPHPYDNVMIVKDQMASVEVSQIILMVPTTDIPCLLHLPLQPQGEHPRRVASESDHRKVHNVVLNKCVDGWCVHAKGLRLPCALGTSYAALVAKVSTVYVFEP